MDKKEAKVLHRDDISEIRRRTTYEMCAIVVGRESALTQTPAGDLFADYRFPGVFAYRPSKRSALTADDQIRAGDVIAVIGTRTNLNKFIKDAQKKFDDYALEGTE